MSNKIGVERVSIDEKGVFAVKSLKSEGEFVRTNAEGEFSTSKIGNDDVPKNLTGHTYDGITNQVTSEGFSLSSSQGVLTVENSVKIIGGNNSVLNINTLANSATVDTTNASNITRGVLANRLLEPALNGHTYNGLSLQTFSTGFGIAGSGKQLSVLNNIVIAGQDGSTVATLDSNGKLPVSQLPDIAITSYLGAVDSEEHMLTIGIPPNGLTRGQQGDYCIRTENFTNWILTGDDQTNISNWVELLSPPDAVKSVAGKIGNVVLDGADIISGTIANLRTTATSSNVPSTIVARDINGSFEGTSLGNVAKIGDMMTGPLVLPSGTSSVPALQFTGSTGVGISAISGTLSVITNSNEVMKFDTSGTVKIPNLNTAGIVHTDANGLLTTSQVTNSETTATSTNTASAIVARDALGDFSARKITADLLGSATSFTGNLTGDVTGTQDATVVSTVGGKTSSAVAASVLLTEGATDTNTVSKLVLRNNQGNFSANTITANLVGSATSFTGNLAGDVTGTQGATVVSTVGMKTAADVALATNTVFNATSSNNGLALVKRDNDGGFSAYKISLSGAVTDATDVTTKAYVDTTTSLAIVPKTPARVVSTTNVSLTGLQTIDSVTLSSGDRILLVGQALPKENGIWLANASTWGRSTVSEDFKSTEKAGRAYVLITEGNFNGGSSWLCNTSDAIIDTDDITFTQFSIPGTTTCVNVGTGAGVFKTKLGNMISLKSLVGSPHVSIANNADEIVVSTDATSANTASTIVSRDSSGYVNLGGATITTEIFSPVLRFSSTSNISATSNIMSLVTSSLERLRIDALGFVRIFSLNLPGVIHTDTFGNLTTSKIVDADISSTAAIADTKLATISTSGKVANSALPIALTNHSYNGLTLTAAATGFTISGGTTTSRTLTLTNFSGTLVGSAFVDTRNATNITSGLLAVARGGTGQSTYAIGDILVASAATTLSRLPAAGIGLALISAGANTQPLYGKIGLGTHVNGVLPVANGGTGQNTYSDGQLLIGNTTGNTLALGTLGTDGSIVVTNGAGSISLKVASALTGKTYNGLSLTSNATGFLLSGGTTSKTLTVSNNITIAGPENSTVATLDSSGKLFTSQLPDLAIVSYLGIAANASMMTTIGAGGLPSAQQGDWCIRSDLKTTWTLIGNDQTILTNWTQIEYPVTSVAGKKGDVTLNAADILGLSLSATTDATNASNISTGLLAIPRGGTGFSTYSDGEILVGSSPNLVKKTIVSSDSSVTVSQTPSTINLSVSASNISSGILSNSILPTNFVSHTYDGLTNQTLANGFSITGGTTPKTLVVSNSITLSGNDGKILNIADGGTLGALAFLDTIDTGRISSGVLPIARGGTGVNVAPIDGQFLIGSGGSYALTSISGTLNRIIVTNSPGAISITTPQELHNLANVTFRSVTLTTGSVSNAPLLGNDITNKTYVDASTTVNNVGTGTGLVFKNKTTNGLNFKSFTANAPLSITNGTDDLTLSLSGIVPVANGGTGQFTYDNGDLLIGNGTGNTLSKGNISSDGSIVVTNNPGSISLAVASALTGKTYNGLSVTTSPSGFSLSSLKTLTVANNITIAGPENSTVATLDSSGKLHPTQIPDIAIVSFLGTVDSEAHMLAVGTSPNGLPTGEQGDWCIRSDTGSTWIMTGPTQTLLSSWTQLAYPASPVMTVAGRVGNITLSTSDIAGIFPVSQGGTGIDNYNSGQLLIGNSAGNLSKGFITSTDGSIGITNGSGSINISISSALSGKTYDGLTNQALTNGFSITGGITPKTFSLLNTVTLSGIDGSVLNISTGGTLVTSAFRDTTNAVNITSGILAVTCGGTGFNSYSTGDILYASAPGILSKLPADVVGKALISGTVPTYDKIGLSTHVNGILPIANGGTGNTGIPTNGQLLIGNGTGFSLAGINGTTNQISVTGGAGTITLSTPQNLDTAANVSFNSLTIASGTLTTAPTISTSIVSKGYVDTALNLITAANTGTGSGIFSSKVGNTLNFKSLIVSTPLSITNTANDITIALTNPLPIANGGTGNTAIPTNGQLLIGNGTGYTQANLTSNGSIAITNGSGSISIAINTVTVPRGGTGLTAYTVGDILYASAGNTLSSLAAVASGRVLKSNGVGIAPSYGQVDLTNMVTGVLPIANGGTSISTYATGDIPYASANNTLSKLSVGTLGQVLVSNGSVPSYGQVNLATAVTNVLPAANGGTGQSSYTTGDILYASGANTLAKLQAGTSGQVLKMNAFGIPSWGAATALTMDYLSAYDSQANQTIATVNTFQPVLFRTVASSSGWTQFDTSTFQCKTPGVYTVQYTLSYFRSAAFTANAFSYISKNGTELVGSYTGIRLATGVYSLSSSFVVPCAFDDKINVNFTADSSSVTLTWDTGYPGNAKKQSAYISIYRIA